MLIFFFAGKDGKDGKNGEFTIIEVCLFSFDNTNLLSYL